MGYTREYDTVLTWSIDLLPFGVFSISLLLIEQMHTVLPSHIPICNFFWFFLGDTLNSPLSAHPRA